MEPTVSAIGKFQIRKATSEDALTIAQINVISSKHVYCGILDQGFLDQLTREKRAAVYAKRLADSKISCFVAIDPDSQKIIGFTDLGPNRNSEIPYESELYSIYCLPEFQKQGVGSMLMKLCLDKAKEQYRNMIVSVFSANQRACNFYEKMKGKEFGSSSLEIAGINYAISNYGWDFGN